MLHIEIVGRLVQKQDVRFFQQEFSEKDLGTLSTGQFRHITLQSQIQQSQRPCYLFDFRVNDVKIVHRQKILDRSQFFHHLFHLFRGSLSHLIADGVHLLFQFIQPGKRRRQHFPDGHSLFQFRMLIQITHTHIFCPLNFSLVRHHPIGDDLKKRGFSFSIGSYQSDMLPLQ